MRPPQGRSWRWSTAIHPRPARSQARGNLRKGDDGMFEKERDLATAFVRKHIGRRELLQNAGRLGLGAAAGSVLANRAMTQALAADFDWKKHNGTKLKLLLNKHPYVDALVADLGNFKSLTGMD